MRLTRKHLFGAAGLLLLANEIRGLIVVATFGPAIWEGIFG